MLVKTTELALRALTLLALEGDGTPTTPKQLAERLECSVSYLSKTLGVLVKAGILESLRGAYGGVVLRRCPSEITLLDVVVACQGVLVPDHCSGTTPPEAQCAFHIAMQDVYEQTMSALRGWTLADLAARPVRCRHSPPGVQCKMTFTACERHDAWCAGDEAPTR